MAKNIHLLQNKYYERPTRWWFVLMFSFWDVSLLILWHCRLGRHQIKLVSKKENEFEVKIHLGNKKPWTSEPVTFAPGWAGMVTHGGGGHRRHLYLREKKNRYPGVIHHCSSAARWHVSKKTYTQTTWLASFGPTLCATSSHCRKGGRRGSGEPT